MRFDVLRTRLGELQDQLQRDVIQRDILLKSKSRLSLQLEETKQKLAQTEKARELLNALVSHRKRTTLDKIEQLVTYGLQTIFEQPAYKFTIETSTIRKQTAYSFKLSDGAHDTVDIENARGGGVVNVTAFLLAVVVQLLLEQKARTFILDEKFSHVSVKYVPNIAELLSFMAKKMKVQFIQVTHQDPLAEASDTVYIFQKDKQGVTTATRKK